MDKDTKNAEEVTSNVEHFTINQILNGEGVSTDFASQESVTESTTESLDDSEKIDDGDAESSNEIQESDVIEFLKSKGREIESIDDLFKEKEVDPYESLLSDDEKRLLDFKKAGGTEEEFQFQNTDWDKASVSELIKIKLERESGLQLSDEDVAEYIEDALGISYDSEDLSVKERVKLNTFLKEIKDTLKKEQSDLSNKIKNKENIDKDDVVVLDNGFTMSKKDYDNQIKQREIFLEKNKEAAGSVTEFPFSIEISEGQGKKKLDFTFEMSEKDKQSMLSISNDVSSYVNETYGSGDEFKQKEFNADLFWLSPSNRSKAISSLLHQARAQAIEEVMKAKGNVNLKSMEPLSSEKEKEGVKFVSPVDILGM